MKLNAPLLPLAVMLMVGIWAGQWTERWPVLLAMLIAVVVASCFSGRFPRLQTAGIYAATVLIGMLLASRQRQQLNVHWPQKPSDVTLVVMSESKFSAKTVSFDVVTADGHHKLRCYVRRDADSEQISLGQGLRITAIINKVREYKNGHFDYRRYMQCHGYTGQLYANNHQWQWKTVSLSALSRTDRLRLRFLLWRHQLLQHVRQQISDDSAYGVLAAMTLGEKTALDKELKETFSQVGASHILALSGLHLMILYSVITLVLGWHRYHAVTQVATILMVWAFALLTGLSTSVVRSAFMISIYALLSVGHRERMSVNTLAFVAIVLLMVNPMALYDLGFQLSFMAVLGIVLIHPLINNLVPAHVQLRHRLLSSAWGLVTVSLAAQIATAPLVAYYFGRFSTWFLLSNFIVIPAAWLILHAALLAVVCCWWPWALHTLATVLTWLVSAMNHALTVVSQWPMSSIEDIRLSALQVCLIYIIIAGCYVIVSLTYPVTRRNG